MKLSYFIFAGMLNTCLMTQLQAAQMREEAQQTVSQEEQEQKAFERLISRIYEENPPTTEIKNLLQKHPAIVNMQDSNGITPLMHAAGYTPTEIYRPLTPAKLAIVKLLVAIGADVSMQDAEGRTALMMAYGQGYGPQIQNAINDGLQEKKKADVLFHIRQQKAANILREPEMLDLFQTENITNLIHEYAYGSPKDIPADQTASNNDSDTKPGKCIVM